MRHTKTILLLALAAAVAGGLSVSACKPRHQPVAEPAADAAADAAVDAAMDAAVDAATNAAVKSENARLALRQLFAEEWERGLRESPTTATYLGDKRYADRWDDLSPAAFERRQAGNQAALERLHAIDRSLLAAADQLNYELFGKQLQDGIEGYRFHGFLLPLNQRGGIQTTHEMLEAMRFESVADYEAWLARLHSFDTYMDQTIALLRQGMAEGRMYPRIAMQRIPAQIALQRVGRPEDSPMYAPFLAFPQDVPEQRRAELADAAAQALRDSVLPAFQRLAEFFQNEYLPACPEAVGLSAQPGGAEYYAWLARHHTTTELTPEQIHEIGLSEVRRIRSEMEQLKAQLGFSGDLPAFFAFLRSDPQFYYRSPAELFAGYLGIAKRIDPELVHLFSHLPRLPYGLRPIPEASAPDTTTAYYYPGAADGSRAGYYYVNLYKPETRPKWEMEVLTVHESVPGHHLQIALQQELGDMPQFRKNGSDYTAFVEGWGLYSESLGSELGLYRDPYSRFGQLSYQMWRAVRLVVDTGMHAKGWSRERAIAYFRDNAPKTELDIVNEIDRYLVMPGQALAYKLGELKLRALRARAEIGLGPRFDLRAFHDLVLGSGAIPLDVLERKVDDWIATSRAPT